MLSTPFNCCSSGVATDCSIVVASPPVNVVFTMICGGTICGNCARGSLLIETSPARTVTMEITIATIGRLTKNLAIGCLPFFLLQVRCSGCYNGSVFDLLQALYNDSLLRLEPVLDDQHLADVRADLYRTNAHFVVRSHHCQLIAALQFRDGPLRDQQR